MGIVDKEYTFGINKFKKPNSVTNGNAIGTRLMELIMMEPGDDPLHPEMGVGLKTFRYGVNNLDKLKTRVENQIATYLPFYQNVNVAIIRTPDKVCNIEITIGNTLYVYDSNEVTKPIKLEDIQS